jgi:inosine/xanthosine triphosphatase
MSKVLIASQNPVKIEATRTGFSRLFPSATFTYESIAVPSGIPDQPIGHMQTLTGARNRAHNALKARPDVDYAVGIEGGVAHDYEDSGRLQVFAWIVVLRRFGDGDMQEGKAQTGVFYLPQEVAELILQKGMELGDADDVVFGRTNSKQANGSIGLLTHDAMTRHDFYVPAVMMALIPFANDGLTWH